MTHASLFSGIGGFDLAAHWAGIENVFAVEKDDFCRKVLKKNFPELKLYEDIYEFDGTKYRGRIDIISGGFPCQPFSLAGKRAGVKDDRYLWDEMFRVVQEINPKWVIAENVRGITSISDGDVFEQVCNDLETADYQIQPFIIPAVSVGAPHKRERVWFVAHSDSLWEPQQKRTFQNKRGRIGNEIKQDITADPESVRCGRWGGGNDSNDRGRQFRQNKQNDWHEIRCKAPSSIEYNKPNGWDESWFQAFTRIYGVDDGLPGGMDGLGQRYKNRSRKHRIKAMGNAIVPQIAEIIFKLILESERRAV